MVWPPDDTGLYVNLCLANKMSLSNGYIRSIDVTFTNVFATDAFCGCAIYTVETREGDTTYNAVYIAETEKKSISTVGVVSFSFSTPVRVYAKEYFVCCLGYGVMLGVEATPIDGYLADISNYKFTFPPQIGVGTLSGLLISYTIGDADAKHYKISATIDPVTASLNIHDILIATQI